MIEGIRDVTRCMVDLLRWKMHRLLQCDLNNNERDLVIKYMSLLEAGIGQAGKCAINEFPKSVQEEIFYAPIPVGIEFLSNDSFNFIISCLTDYFIQSKIVNLEKDHYYQFMFYLCLSYNKIFSMCDFTADLIPIGVSATLQQVERDCIPLVNAARAIARKDSEISQKLQALAYYPVLLYKGDFSLKDILYVETDVRDCNLLGFVESRYEDIDSIGYIKSVVDVQERRFELLFEGLGVKYRLYLEVIHKIITLERCAAGGATLLPGFNSPLQFMKAKTKNIIDNSKPLSFIQSVFIARQERTDAFFEQMGLEHHKKEQEKPDFSSKLKSGVTEALSKGLVNSRESISVKSQMSENKGCNVRKAGESTGADDLRKLFDLIISLSTQGITTDICIKEKTDWYDLSVLGVYDNQRTQERVQDYIELRGILKKTMSGLFRIRINMETPMYTDIGIKDMLHLNKELQISSEYCKALTGFRKRKLDDYISAHSVDLVDSISAGEGAGAESVQVLDTYDLENDEGELFSSKGTGMEIRKQASNDNFDFGFEVAKEAEANFVAEGIVDVGEGKLSEIVDLATLQLVASRFDLQEDVESVSDTRRLYVAALNSVGNSSKQFRIWTGNQRVINMIAAVRKKICAKG